VKNLLTLWRQKGKKGGAGGRHEGNRGKPSTNSFAFIPEVERREARRAIKEKVCSYQVKCRESKKEKKRVTHKCFGRCRRGGQGAGAPGRKSHKKKKRSIENCWGGDRYGQEQMSAQQEFF